MLAASPDLARAFRALERRLAARRLAGLDARGRVVLALLGAILAGFAYWQVHGPLAGVVRSHGPGRGLVVTGLALAGLAILGGALAGWRRVALAMQPPGPEWLALPASPGRVVAHLHSEARWVGAIALAPAAGALAAAASSLPPAALGSLALGFAAAWIGATRVGTALAWRACLTPALGVPVLSASTRALLTAGRAAGHRAHATPRWRRRPAWRALVELDARVTARHSAARSRFVWVLVLAALGLAAWMAPAPLLTRRALAFVAFATSCALLGSWAIARTCGDPAGVMRPLPLGLSTVWRARAAIAGGIVVALAIAHALLATGVPWPARLGQVLAWSLPGITIALLGLHYALTLAPRATVAEGLYAAWLVLALLASLMVPLLGWGLLLGGLVHSSMRLRRWWRPEVE